MQNGNFNTMKQNDATETIPLNVFVSMPYDSDTELQKYWSLFYKKAIEPTKEIIEKETIFRIELINKRKDKDPGEIPQLVSKSLDKANILICILTGFRPNVMYEVGYARSMGIPCIFMLEKSNKTTLPTLLGIPLIIHYDGIDKNSFETIPTELSECLKKACENAQVENKKISTNLSKDIIESNIGIDRLWKDRHSWQDNKHDGLDKWRNEYIPNASCIQIQSNTFWNNWLKDKKFLQCLCNLLENTCIEILFLDPESEMLGIRGNDEDELNAPHKRGKTLKKEIIRSLNSLYKYVHDKSKHLQNNLEIRLSREYILLSQIIRADNRMLVTTYLSGKTGSFYPTMQLCNDDTHWFKTYAEQFQINWDRSTSREINFQELEKIVKKYEVKQK